MISGITLFSCDKEDVSTINPKETNIKKELNDIFNISIDQIQVE
ncbi:hypothetical protein [Mesoflavibacter sp. CH_XMU1404-2]